MAVAAVPDPIDSTVDDATATVSVHDWALEVIELEDEDAALRARRDALKSAIRVELQKRGRDVLSFPDLSIRLSPAREAYCVCHGTEVALCPVARARRSVEVTLRDCIPYVKVAKRP